MSEQNTYPEAKVTPEQAKLPSTVSENAGHLATSSIAPERPSSHSTEWVTPEQGLQRKVDGVHLGRKVGQDGWNAGFKDTSSTPVPEVGISFIAWQASHGPTGIDAKALPGFRVAAAEYDLETGEVTWNEPKGEDEQVRVASDWGNMSTTSFEDWANANLGNPGNRVGVVRVTGADGSNKYYALGAQFQGEPDDWNVKGGIIEVVSQTTQAISGSHPELPPI